MRKRLIALALAGLLGAAGVGVALAQSSGPPPLPNLGAQQSDILAQETNRYREEVDARVARGEIRPDEAQRLVEWRRWQIAQQIAGMAPQSGPMASQGYGYPAPHEYGYPAAQGYGGYPPPEAPPIVVQRQYVYPAPPPPAYYNPWYRPYYYGPRVSVCAGGAGHHAFGSICF